MSHRNWLHLIALGGFLAVTLFSRSVLAKDDNSKHQEEADRASYTIQQAGPKLGPIPRERKEPAKTDWANPECNKPKDHDEADLCVQRQMAHTAQSTLYSNYVQIGLGVIGAWLLLWTLRYTGRATEAAAVAARAARDSADALPNLERAYIFIELDPHVGENIRKVLLEIATKPGYRDGRFGLHVDIRYQFINHGKTPAIIEVMTSKLDAWEALPSEILFSDERLPQEIVVRAGDIYPDRAKNLQLGLPDIMPLYSYHNRVQSTGDEIKFNAAESIRSGRSFVWFYGQVVYKDVFGKSHKTRFCWRYSWPNTFEQYNREGEDLNGRT
jgi:hypothetical protein